MQNMNKQYFKRTTWNGDGFPSAVMNEISNSSTLTLSIKSILPISTGVGKVMTNVVTALTSSNGSEESGLKNIKVME